MRITFLRAAAPRQSEQRDGNFTTTTRFRQVFPMASTKEKSFIDSRLSITTDFSLYVFLYLYFILFYFLKLSSPLFFQASPNIFFNIKFSNSQKSPPFQP